MSSLPPGPLSSVLDALTHLISTGLDFPSSPPSVFSPPPIAFSDAKSICGLATAAFASEPTLLDLKGNFFIVGDIHGHILEFLRILRDFGIPPKTRYLLLGDLVDRGEFSVQTVLYVLALKAAFPCQFYVIRGNHESEEICGTHGLLAEIVEVYGNDQLFSEMVRAFGVIPLAARVNSELLCVHGGISPGLETVEQIRGITRPLRPADNAIADALLWSDPTANATAKRVPPARGFDFGEDVLGPFLERNKLRLLVRGHEAVKAGIVYGLHGKVVTVFSISNYCDREAGVAGVLEVGLDQREEKAHILPALPWVVRKAVAPVVPPTARVLSTVPVKQAASQPPIVMRQFMRSRGRNKGGAAGLAA
jgi:diadenosine tetraphosphatase ApaH/serine/threonine PP2A family protein phosphatase